LNSSLSNYWITFSITIIFQKLLNFKVSIFYIFLYINGKILELFHHVIMILANHIDLFIIIDFDQHLYF
jgi:hypothetical protein